MGLLDQANDLQLLGGGYLIPRLPIRDHTFFEQTLFQGQIRNNFVKRGRLTPQILNLVRSRGTSRVTGQAFLAGL